MDYSTYKRDFYRKDFDTIKHFIDTYRSNYALATHLFPQRIREATLILYAFVRYADELVDNPNVQMIDQTHKNLKEFIDEFNHVIKSGVSAGDIVHPIIRANYFLFQTYNIPFDYLHDFLLVMESDNHIHKYQNYEDLEKYMWGSATVIGHIMTFIIGYSDEVAFDHARALAEGMQLANFLRDIHEDYTDRSRIYLPVKDRMVFGVDDEVFEKGFASPAFKNLMRFYVEKSESLFKKGIDGISLLEKPGRFPVLLAAYVYRDTLRIIKKRDYNVFGSRIHISKSRKIILCIRACWDYITYRYEK